MTPVGSRIGKYEVQGEVGRGALTRAYLGYDPTVGRRVVIKVLTEEGDEALAGQFRREAAAAANLHHKNIVTIYELGEYSGGPFIAMEYLEGVDLRQGMGQGKQLTLLQKMLTMWQVGEALQCAHHSGGVHLDLKPANILLLSDGLVKMVDFGMVGVSLERALGMSEQGYLEQEMRYMSPEQVRSWGGADKLGDIFTYGMIYYELLTGRHPFEAADGRGVREKIAREEPEPVGRLVKGCPEGLERVIRRALEKDRELRYGSMEDLQFDVEPVLGELKRQRAGKLVEEARETWGKQQWEAARGLLREALELEAGNQEARQLLERIREQQQRQAIRKRVAALVAEAEEAQRGRRFEEAVEGLEAAQRLDAGDEQVRALLEQSRGRLERSQRAGALVAEAKRQIQQQRLEEAQRQILEALEADPEDSEAGRLGERIEKEIAERDRQARLQEGLVKAQCLVLAESFEEAIAVLIELRGEHPGCKQVEERLAEARRDKAARERQQQLEAGLGAARELVDKQRLGEAVERLEALNREFGGEAEVRKMLAEAREELHKRERAQAVQKVRSQAMALAGAGDFIGAIEVLAHGLKSFPEEVDLRRVLQVLEDTAMDLSSKISRGEPIVPELETQRFVHTTLARVTILEDREQWRTALAVLEQALERCPSSPELAQAHSRVKSRSSDAERRQKIGRRIEVIGQKMAEQAWLPAILLIEASLAEFPDEPDLKRLLDRAHAARRFANCESVIASIQQSLADGDLEQAENILHRAAEAYPIDPRLPSLREELNREKVYRSQFRQAEILFSRHRFEEAGAILTDLRARKPADRDVQALLETVRLERVPQQDKQYYTQGREQAMALVRNRQFDRALEVLQELLSRFPEDSVIQRDVALVRGAQAQEQISTQQPGNWESKRRTGEPSGPEIGNQLVPFKRPHTIITAQNGGAQKRLALIAIPVLFLILLIVILVWKA